MKKAENGSKVSVHYVGKLDDGEVFDSSADRDPLSFVIGEKQVIPGFETAVMGMAPGEKKDVHIEVDDAYGPYREQMVLKVNRDQFPNDLDPAEGQMLQVQTDQGQTVQVRVSEVGEKQVTLDANHPLAGKALNFELELVAVD